jgi:hypothetical protein
MAEAYRRANSGSIKKRAKQLGADVVGIASAATLDAWR